MITDKTFEFISDPGHGWLRVTHSDIKDLEIENEITKYSYKNEHFAFLEEDCDAPTFINAYKDKYGEEPDIHFRNVNGESSIRYQQHYG